MALQGSVLGGLAVLPETAHGVHALRRAGSLTNCSGGCRLIGFAVVIMMTPGLHGAGGRLARKTPCRNDAFLLCPARERKYAGNVRVLLSVAMRCQPGGKAATCGRQMLCSLTSQVVWSKRSSVQTDSQ